MFSKIDIEIIKALQRNLPLVSRPYKAVAEKIGITEEELLDRVKTMKEAGYIRRLGAALRHREVGMAANAMIVMEVPEEDCERIGKAIAAFPQVTHCYQRPMKKDWPFSIFAMIHFPTREECEEMAEKIFKEIGESYPYRLLYSSQELKKTSMRYFLD